MKQRILTILAALVCLCLILELSPPSLTGLNSFYFAKRQWLADARTIVAGVRYLYESRMAYQTNSTDVANVPHSPPIRPAISTTSSGVAELKVEPNS